MPLFTDTVSDENTARFPDHEWVIICQRFESNESKSSRNTKEKSPTGEPLDDELLLEEELELDELLLDEEEFELDELELALGVLPPHDMRGTTSKDNAPASKFRINGCFPITNGPVFEIFYIFC